MTDTNKTDEQVKARKDGFSGNERQRSAIGRVLVALCGIVVIGLVGLVAVQLSQRNPDDGQLTTEREEFNSQGDAFGQVRLDQTPDPVVIIRQPATKVVEVENTANQELLDKLNALADKVDALQNQPTETTTVNTGNDLAAELRARIKENKAAHDAAMKELHRSMSDAELEAQRLRSELDIARLNGSNTLAPVIDNTPKGPTPEDIRQARIRSGIVAFGGTASAAPSNANDSSDVRSGNTRFVRDGASTSSVTQAQTIANPANTILQGTVIQAITETAIDSTLAGEIRAQVSQDVHSFDGTNVLIPRGSKLIGRYNSDVSLAQKRILIAWDRILLPDAQTIEISAFGGDALGRSGTSGFVDKHFGERFGSAALISLMGAVPSAIANQSSNEVTQDTLSNVGEDLQSATQNAVGEYLSIPPTIYVDQGSKVTVMVDRDLEIFE